MAITYKTNPNKRCCLCKGREVITIEDGVVIHKNLKKVSTGINTSQYFCKDEAECKQNIEAENTFIHYEEGKDGKPRMNKIISNGETIIEVDYDV